MKFPRESFTLSLVKMMIPTTLTSSLISFSPTHTDRYLLSLLMMVDKI